MWMFYDHIFKKFQILCRLLESIRDVPRPERKCRIIHVSRFKCNGSMRPYNWILFWRLSRISLLSSFVWKIVGDQDLGEHIPTKAKKNTNIKTASTLSLSFIEAMLQGCPRICSEFLYFARSLPHDNFFLSYDIWAWKNLFTRFISFRLWTWSDTPIHRFN